MGKKIGDKINVRHGATYDYDTKSCNNANDRGSKQVTITKVLPHGVKTKEMGYVNNKLIIN